MHQSIIIKIFILIHLFFIFSTFQLFGNETKVLSDTVHTRIDTLATLDTLAIQKDLEPKRKTGVDTLVEYGAKGSIDFSVDSKMTWLEGSAWVKYGSMKLNAEKIVVKWEENILTAEGVVDSVDSLGKPIYKGLPEFSDGDQLLKGARMVYNFKTKKGRVLEGNTKLGDGYYYGEVVKKVEDKVFNVSIGKFTSCDAKEPHYYFYSPQMKLISKDKVIAKPVYMYIAYVPIFWIPYAVLPSKGGRKSGWITPRFGFTERQGRNIQNFGYFWAVNDYWDNTFYMDFYDKLGFLFKDRIRYNKWQALNGNLELSSTFFNEGRTSLTPDGVEKQRWQIIWNHSQQEYPISSFSTNIDISSDRTFTREYSTNVEDRLNQFIVSTASYRRSEFLSDDGSINLSINRYQNLQTNGDNITTSGSYSNKESSTSIRLSREIIAHNGVQVKENVTLPSISFSLNQRQFITPPIPKRGQKKTDIETKWYNSIYYSYSSDVTNSIHGKTKGDLSEITKGDYSKIMNHNFRITSSQKVFGWLSIGPNFSYVENWVDRYFAPDDSLLQLKRGFKTRRDFSFSTGASTTVYGMFNPDLEKLKYLRHVVTPSISYNFEPATVGKFFEYYDTFQGKRYDIFDGNFESTTPKAQQSISLSVGNLFQAKLIEKVEEEEKTQKVDLFNLNFSTGYNFSLDSFNLYPLNASLSTNILNKFRVTLSSQFDFYKSDASGKRINKYLFKKSGKLARMTNLNFDISTSYEYKGGAGKVIRFEDIPDDSLEIYRRREKEQKETATQEYLVDTPFNADINLHYNENRNNPNNIFKSFDANFTINTQLTKGWKINYRTTIDFLAEDKIINQSFAIVRDLHCWEMRIDVTPSGVNPGFYFIIQIKSSDLRDIKIEHREYERGFF